MATRLPDGCDIFGAVWVICNFATESPLLEASQHRTAVSSVMSEVPRGYGHKMTKVRRRSDESQAVRAQSSSFLLK